jgi:RecA/RadA recombinase
MEKLTKDFGKLAEDMPKPQDNVISLSSPSFNWAVGNGGIVQGKSICLFGPESGGKSLLMQLIMARIQQEDPEAIGILFDAEYSFNPEWFIKLGGDPKRLIVRQSNDPLKIFDYMSPEGEMYEMLQEGAPIRFVGIDSVKAIRYPKDIKTKSTDQVMGGGGASYLGSALKGVLPVIREFNITTIMVQQVYEEMDKYKKMNNPYIVPDGRALKHFCDYMIQVEKLETKAGRIEEGTNIHGGAQQVGHIIRAKCKKNRLAAPYRTAQLTLRYEGGITDTDVELFDLAKSLGVIYHPMKDGKVNNQMWQVGNHDPIRGEANIRDFVLNNPDVQREILAELGEVTDEQVARRNVEVAVADINIDADDI